MPTGGALGWALGWAAAVTLNVKLPGRDAGLPTTSLPRHDSAEAASLAFPKVLGSRSRLPQEACVLRRWFHACPVSTCTSAPPCTARPLPKGPGHQKHCGGRKGQRGPARARRH